MELCDPAPKSCWGSPWREASSSSCAATPDSLPLQQLRRKDRSLATPTQQTQSSKTIPHILHPSINSLTAIDFKTSRVSDHSTILEDDVVTLVTYEIQDLVYDLLFVGCLSRHLKFHWRFWNRNLLDSYPDWQVEVLKSRNAFLAIATAVHCAVSCDWFPKGVGKLFHSDRGFNQDPIEMPNGLCPIFFHRSQIFWRARKIAKTKTENIFRLPFLEPCPNFSEIWLKFWWREIWE